MYNDNLKDTLIELKSLVNEPGALKLIDGLMDMNYTCAYCGNLFSQKVYHTRFCSNLCQTRYKAYIKAIKERCIKFDINSIDFTLTPPRVYRMFAGKCQYCGCKVATDGDWKQEDYFNIEHKRPLSRGGIHQISNITLSCRKCNMEKLGLSHGEYRGYKSNPFGLVPIGDDVAIYIMDELQGSIYIRPEKYSENEHIRPIKYTDEDLDYILDQMGYGLGKGLYKVHRLYSTPDYICKVPFV